MGKVWQRKLVWHDMVENESFTVLSYQNKLFGWFHINSCFVLFCFFQSLMTDETIANVPILILGNKIDRPEAISEERLREMFGLYGQTTGKVKKKKKLWWVCLILQYKCLLKLLLLNYTSPLSFFFLNCHLYMGVFLMSSFLSAMEWNLFLVTTKMSRISYA